MQATKETVQKRPHTALWVILCVVLLCAAGAALYFCRWAEKPLTLAEGYVAAEGLTADITDGEGAVLSQPVRGTKVTYVVEDEDKDHPGLARAFPEIVEASRACRFGDCTHTHEPGCAVREAEDAGQIDSLRLETFQNLASSMRVSAQMLDPDVHL